MRTNTIQEKVFDHEFEATENSLRIHDLLLKKITMYQALGHGLNELYEAMCHTLDHIPIYHQIELSIADATIKINLEISILNPIEDGVPVYNCTEHVIIFNIAQFLDEEIIENGCLAYNPAEGF